MTDWSRWDGNISRNLRRKDRGKSHIYALRWLCSCYISPHRYSQILANNVPGDDYYRLPTVTSAIKLRDEEIKPIEWEGTFFEYKDEEEWYIRNAFKV
jgi:hypothetical protein